MSLRLLSSNIKLKNMRVLLRVDWNIPLYTSAEPEHQLKIQRSFETLKFLRERQAVVTILTHIGNPEANEAKFSTRHLVPFLQKEHISVTYHQESISDVFSLKTLQERLKVAVPGSFHLLENVRFESGEEKNDTRLAKAYASLGQIFVNDAFASCHRRHTSVVGIAKRLPSYAGFGLADEVKHLQQLIEKLKRPFVVIIGGLKLSTKIPIIKALLPLCDTMCIGGAMATTIQAAAELGSVGKSFVDREVFAQAKVLAKQKNILLPMDVQVTDRIHGNMKLRRVNMESVAAKDMIVDIGPMTLLEWGKKIAASRTILWNGPVGVTEYPASGFGSRGIARMIALHAKGSAFCVSGGGDTIPLIFETRTQKKFDFVSTGGGAMLEFLALKGRLPGILPLLNKR